MSAEPVGPVHPADRPVTAPYEVIHLGSPSRRHRPPRRVPSPARPGKHRVRTGARRRRGRRRRPGLARPRSPRRDELRPTPRGSPPPRPRRLNRRRHQPPVSLDEKAIHQATAFLAEDPDGLRAVLAAIDALSEHPYPGEAFPFGSTGLHRLRVGRYRVLYRYRRPHLRRPHRAGTRRPLTFRDPRAAAVMESNVVRTVAHPRRLTQLQTPSTEPQPHRSPSARCRDVF